MARPVRSVPRIFLFSDLRGYTVYVEHAGDAAAKRLLQTYRSIVRRIVEQERGTEIKTEGDSFYVVFRSSASAVHCAIAIQRTAAHRKDPLEIGIGIHAGEAIPFDRQYVGGAVNIAARLAAAASAGEVLISETVRGLVRTAVPVPLEDRGLLTLKGVAEPIRAYAIRPIKLSGRARPELPPSSPFEAALRGQLNDATRLAQEFPAVVPPDLRCEGLAALAVVAAVREDLERALGYTERLAAVAPRAADASWVRATYALRAWLYFLARQRGEAVAELERALERSGAGSPAVVLSLLAVSIAGDARHTTALHEIAAACQDASLRAACLAVVDVLEGRRRVESARKALVATGRPLLADLAELQLIARTQGQQGIVRAAATRPAAARLAGLISHATQ